MLNFLQNFVSRWDGHSYLFLAQNGYVTTGDEKYFIVFPPLYPSLIKILNLLINNPYLSAFIISLISIILALFIFYKLLLLDYNKSKSIWITLTVAIFPTSYFFLTAYPESLFFLLIVLSLYFARTNKFKYSSIAAFFATLTRPFGILIWPSILIEWFLNKKRNYLDLILILSFSFLASSIYLSINYSLFGNPLMFEVFLKTHWQKSFAFPWQGIISSWQRGFNTPSTNPEYKYIVGFAEAFASTIPYTFIFLNLIFKKIRMRFSYFAYFILATIMMTSTSFLLSTPRYLLSIPPFFITLGILTNKKILRIIWGIISISLLIYFGYLFTIGHWAF
ncbi:MAG TPA: hypothetical protein VG895_04265 [Patescibacteria group bacterium]|nr:hypothetical protein [Patescibacteria group bacterium]